MPLSSTAYQDKYIMLAISWLYVLTETEKKHTPTLGPRNVGDCQWLQYSLKPLKMRGSAVRNKCIMELVQWPYC